MSARHRAPRASNRFAAASLLLLSGCSSFQPSYYENRSRDGENRVVAHGQAASHAAWVHTSNASLGQGTVIPGGSNAGRSPAAQTDLLAESGQRLYADTLRGATSALSSALERSIREAFR